MQCPSASEQKAALHANTFFIDDENHISFYCGVSYALKASSQTEEVKHVFLNIQHLKIKSSEANIPV